MFFRKYSDLKSLGHISEINLKSYSLKSDSHLSNKIVLLAFFKSPLKMMKNAFYLILKAPFVLKIFCSCRKKGLIRKMRLISRPMWSQPG